jgi:hypothetical protein
VDEHETSDLIEIEVGSRLKVKVKKLNGLEARKASFMARSGDDLDQAKCRAIFAVRGINDEPFPAPKNSGDIDRAMTRFSAAELDAFIILYQDQTNDPDLDEQIKKVVERLKLSSP